MADSSPPPSLVVESRGLAGLVLAAGSGQRFGESHWIQCRSPHLIHPLGRSSLINELTGDTGAKNYLTKNNAIQIELGKLATKTDLDYQPT